MALGGGEYGTAANMHCIERMVSFSLSAEKKMLVKGIFAGLDCFFFFEISSFGCSFTD